MRMLALRIWFKSPLLVTLLAGALLISALAATLHVFLDWQVQNSIRRNAEIKAGNWSERFFATIPNARKMFTDDAFSHADAIRLADSFSMVEILRFELFDTDGTRTFLSGTGHLEGEDASEFMALEVYQTGTPKFLVYHDEEMEHSGAPDTFVEAYVPAVTPSGERVGTIEVYVDASPLKEALEDAFTQISWFLILGTTIVLAVPAAAFIHRTRQLRNKDKRLLELTRYDQLTGVLNRNSISDHLNEVFQKPDATGGLGILFVDVDFFKQVNDRFGHAAGDHLLVHIASILKASTRSKDDIVGRFGGDEFIVLARDISLKDFRNMYCRVLELTKTPLEYEGSRHTPSLSVGAYLTTNGDTQKTALHRADLAVYAAKRNGRGRVVEYSEELEGLFTQEDMKRTA